MVGGLFDVEIGIGTWAWGDNLFWGFGKGYTEEDLQESFDVIMRHPNVLIDTAEVYGMGRSESYIGAFAEATDHRPLVATKFFPFPWRLRGAALLSALRRSLDRLGTAQVDLYQIHWDFPPVSIDTWMSALTNAAEEGLTRHVGVSNYDTQQTLKAHDTLAEYGLRLASNQVKYSLLDRTAERNGLLDLCADLDVRVIAYSPLEQGLLTGKYSLTRPPDGIRGWRYRHMLGAVGPLINTMRDIGHAYAEDGVEKTPAQVALNWCICKGVLPIPGAKNARQATANIGASGWRLSGDEVAILDRLSDDFTYKTRKS